MDSDKITRLKELINANPHLQALTRWGHVMVCISSADHYLHKMEVHPIEMTMDNIMSIDGLLLAFAISYARMFTKAASNFPMLDHKRVYRDARLLEIHERIMSLRNERYAHAFDNDTVEYELEVSLQGGRIKVNPTIHIGIPGDEFAAYRRVVNTLQSYVHGRVHDLVGKASASLGIPIDFPTGPTPAHHLKSSAPSAPKPASPA